MVRDNMVHCRPGVEGPGNQRTRTDSSVGTLLKKINLISIQVIFVFIQFSILLTIIRYCKNNRSIYK